MMVGRLLKWVGPLWNRTLTRWDPLSNFVTQLVNISLYFLIVTFMIHTPPFPFETICLFV